MDQHYRAQKQSVGSILLRPTRKTLSSRLSLLMVSGNLRHFFAYRVIILISLLPSSHSVLPMSGSVSKFRLFYFHKDVNHSRPIHSLMLHFNDSL